MLTIAALLLPGLRLLERLLWPPILITTRRRAVATTPIRLATKSCKTVRVTLWHEWAAGVAVMSIWQSCRFVAVASTAEVPSGRKHACRPYAGPGAEAEVIVSVGISTNKPQWIP